MQLESLYETFHNLFLQELNLSHLGISYAGINKLDDAIREYREAIKINPNDQGTYFNLGVAYNKASKFSEGIDAYLKALELDPLNISAMFNLSLIYKKKKMYAECKKQLEKAIQIAAKTSNEKIHQRISKELDKIKRLIK